ncbi:MAG: hypothetical protein LBP42_07475 [Treponema sp.]|nr:hypothetical protein [Treponema sp.]
MNSRIISFTINGKPVLGFDTGLDAPSFAQAKLAQFITQRGYRISAGTEGLSVEIWQSGGAVEREDPAGGETIVVWGPAFEGERLDLIISDDARKEKALEALLLWLRARLVLEEQEQSPYPWPGGALYGKQGAILFPPERLLRRCLEAEGPEAWLNGAERWVHPDLRGSEAAVFAAGTMLYRIFCGGAPFANGDINLIREDMREGVFIPPRLMAPGLDEELAALISGAIAPIPKKPGEKKRPSLAELAGFFISREKMEYAAFFHPLEDGELIRIGEEKEQFQKKRALTVKTKRFVIRNNAFIAGVIVAAAITGLVIGSILKTRADLPTTRGMEAEEVVTAYYGGFETLDHTLMEACVINKAGSADIDMVTNFFVITRVRQAYEVGGPPVLAARDWIASGSPPTEAMVFGVSDLRIEELTRAEDEVLFRSSYILWFPPAYAPTEDEGYLDEERVLPELPQGFSHTDELRLILHKGAWRIAEIRRDVP